jgi:hypothetical protein
MLKVLVNIALLIIVVWTVAAQQSSTVHPTTERPGNCNSNSAQLDRVRNEASSGIEKGELIIAIARLGKGETSRALNRRRLYSVQAYLSERAGLPEESIVVGEGERTEGYGIVEFYVSGKLLNVLLAKRNEILCVECCGIDEKYYLYRRNKTRQTRGSMKLRS